MTPQASTKLRMMVADAAAENARNDIAFIGQEPFRGFTGDQTKYVKDALEFYARRGAQVAYDTLSLHGHLH